MSDGGEKSRVKIQPEIPISRPNEDAEEGVGSKRWGSGWNIWELPMTR